MHRSKPKPQGDSPHAELEALIASEIREVQKLDAALEAAAGAWRERMPQELDPEFVRITSRKVLIVRVADQAKRYIAELHLRSGVRHHIVSACKGRCSSIRIEVGTPRRRI
jgi:hypothetical protein